MRINYFIFFIAILSTSCEEKTAIESYVHTSDIDHFWTAFDKISATTDTIAQEKYLKELFLDKGTAGLNALINVREYTPGEYLAAIRNHPKFWASIRENTFKSKVIEQDLKEGIDKLRNIYPELKPAKIYFTIGALRTNGTTMDSLVLIGSELAMTDQNTVSSEFPEQIGEARRKFFDTNPIDNLVLLNIHEFVHTQQKPMVHNLLSQSLYEGVAEFVSVKAMETPSATPAVQFGKKHEDQVKAKFEADLFKGYINIRNQWLWSDAENDFGVRDLGYYIGYEICERFYHNAADKSDAIKKMIELDYNNEDEIEAFVDGVHFFSKTLEALHQDFQKERPIVLSVGPFENGSQNVAPSTNYLTISFSKEMDSYYRSIDYGPLGANYAIRFKKSLGYSEDGRTYTFEIEKLTPNKQYQLTIQTGFRDKDGRPLKEPFLIDFKTSKK